MKVPACRDEVLRRYPKLICQGDRSLLLGQLAAVIGTRDPSPQALKNTQMIVSALCSEGFTVVSGLALGVDSAAHKAALRYGRTIAVVPFGPDCPCYPPSNEELYETIRKRNLVIHPFGPDEGTSKWTLAARSRLIAEISDVVFLVEGSEEGGGRRAADHALCCGRPVVLPKSFYSTAVSEWRRPLPEGRPYALPGSTMAGFPDLVCIRRVIPVQGELF